MSAEVIQFVPRPNPKRNEPPAIEITNPHLFNAELAVWPDFTRADCDHYVAPEKDPA